MSENPKLEIIIVDDHPIFRKGLRQAISADKELEIINEAGDGEQALQMIEKQCPDVLVLDIEMPVKTGIEVAKEIQRRQFPVDVAFLTMYKDEDMVDAAVALGVKGYVLKESAVSDIVTCIKLVSSGRYYFSPAILNSMSADSKEVNTLLSKHPDGSMLLPMEKKILQMIGEQKTMEEIADVCKLDRSAVNRHYAAIGQKLDIHGQHALVKFACQNHSLLH